MAKQAVLNWESVLVLVLLVCSSGGYVKRASGEVAFSRYSPDRFSPYSLKAFFTALTAFSSSQGNSFTFTEAFCPALLKVLVTSRHSRPMCP